MPHGVTSALDALFGGFFLLTSFAMVATRQIRGCLRMFVYQSVLLACSAFAIGAHPVSWHLIAVGLITLAAKPVLIPWLLRRTVPGHLFTRREVGLSVNATTSLLIALGFTVLAYVTAHSLLATSHADSAAVNLPIGIAGLLLGGYTLSVRREAVPQLLALLSMENSVFLAGIAIAPKLSIIAELAVAFDALVLAFVIGLLTRLIHERTGHTDVARLAELREETRR
jgi:hydrogenase-4 component E